MDRCNSIMKLPLQIYAESVIFCILLSWNCFQMNSWDLFGDLLLQHLRVLPVWCSSIPQFLPPIQSQTQLSHIDSAACLFFFLLSFNWEFCLIFLMCFASCLHSYRVWAAALLFWLHQVGQGVLLLLCQSSRMLSPKTFSPNPAFVCVVGKLYHSKVGINLSSY